MKFFMLFFGCVYRILIHFPSLGSFLPCSMMLLHKVVVDVGGLPSEYYLSPFYHGSAVRVGVEFISVFHQDRDLTQAVLLPQKRQRTAIAI